jgi:hypothetical protein
VSVRQTGEVSKGIILGVVAIPYIVPYGSAHKILDKTRRAYVALVVAIDADAGDIECSAKGLRTGARQQQRGKSASSCDLDKSFSHKAPPLALG